MSTTLPEAIFDSAKAAALAALRNNAQDLTYWLIPMRGLSIGAPSSWGVGKTTLKGREEIDFMTKISSLQYADVKELYADAMRSSNRADGRAIITTVASNDNLCTFNF
jgi:hypothetical protein